MLYEPPKTKQYLIIGAIAIVLAVLAIAIIPFFFRDKTLQTPVTNLSFQEKTQQERIQKESQKLDQIRKSSGVKDYTPEEINQQSKKIDEIRKQTVK